MGGRGAYYQSGGFSTQEYEATGETINGFKVIRHKEDTRASLPQMSNTPGTVYILAGVKGYKAIGIYGEDRRLKKAIDFAHRHTNRYKNGKVEKLKRGVAHVHNIRGGRENNVRYMTRKEIARFGDTVIAIGGRLNE